MSIPFVGRRNELEKLDHWARYEGGASMSTFARHALAYTTEQDPEAPFDFDRWRADPLAGGSLKLSRLPLWQKRTHILEQAYAGLEAGKQQLLSRIAVLGESAAAGMIAVLNPYLSPEVDPASTAYRQTLSVYEEALAELEERGLLRWDREANTYDQHPVVRAYAYERLEAADRIQTSDRLRDHFAGLPPENLEEATELSQLTKTITIYRLLVEAGRLEEAARFYRGDFNSTLLSALGAYATVLELVEPLFPEGFKEDPAVSNASDRGYLINVVAIAFAHLGRDRESLFQQERTLKLGLEQRAWPALATYLQNYSQSLWKLSSLAVSQRALELACDLAEVAEDEEGVPPYHLSSMADSLRRGAFETAQAHYETFRGRPRPGLAHYQPGSIEHWHCRLLFYRGCLTQAALDEALEVAVRGRNVLMQENLFFLHAEYALDEERFDEALEAAEQALVILRKTGKPTSSRLALRALALDHLGPTARGAARRAGGPGDAGGSATEPRDETLRSRDIPGAGQAKRGPRALARGLRSGLGRRPSL